MLAAELGLRPGPRAQIIGDIKRALVTLVDQRGVVPLIILDDAQALRIGTLPLDGKDARSAALIPTSPLASSGPTAPQMPVQTPALADARLLVTPPTPVSVAVPAPSEAPDTPSRPARKPSVTTGEKPAERPVDPLKSIARSAASCRRQHDAADGPKIVVEYAIGGDGSVTRAVPSTRNELGECLADAVRRARFPPEFKLGLKVEL